MPSPSSAMSRPDIGAALEEYSLQASWQGFVGMRVFPVFESAKQNGEFARIKLEALLQERDTTRAPGSSYNTANYEFEPDSFATRDHGFEEPVDDRESKMYGNYFDAEVIAAARARDAVLRNHERRVAAKVFDEVTWTGASLRTSVSTPWSTIASATPITDVHNAMAKVYENSGLIANALVLNWRNRMYLADCAQVVDRCKYWGGDDPLTITDDLLARALGLRYIITAGAVRNSAAEGQARSIAAIWGNDNAMVCRVAETNDLREPCIGRTIHWGEDGSTIGATIESRRDDGRRSTIITARMDTDEKRLYTQAGHLLENIST